MSRSAPRRIAAAFAASLAGLTTLAAASEAQACGGFFCDAGPTVMTVDQTGETIAFWIDESGSEPYTEAHIQIQYEGDAEQFAWVVPVTGVPEILVGSQTLIDNLLAATVPTFTLQSSSTGDCFGDSGLCGGFALNDASFAADEVGDTGEWGIDTDTSGPEILDRGFAGAFEYVTLTGDDIDEVVTWLDDNGYLQDEEAPPILAEYLDEDFVFLAIKLRNGADIDEIHPLVVRYPGTEPCIPIRLTRIAAVEDMAIRGLFLGQTRVASSNWPQVELEWAQLDWLGDTAASYDELMSLAIDAAGGRAFVTEYAGPDDVVSEIGIYSAAWIPAAYAEIEPAELMDVLASQSLFGCAEDSSGYTCSFGHPLVEGLVRTYLPTPESLDDEEFWDCPACFEALIDTSAWTQQPGFAADFEARISDPAFHALEMLESSSYLTRLSTRLSPHEMIEDPLFHPVTGLGELDNNFTAVQITDCDGGPTTLSLPPTNEGVERVLALPEDLSMPALELDPARRIVRVPATGLEQVEVDNGPANDAIIDAWNDDRIQGPSPWNCATIGARPEATLTLLALFGIAGLQRRRRRRA
ncbi:DUF2330 domain-containing protein [Pseudenhygromyxa sp. WMMC2535]|uniref:DUF2330 domain-containing protein n=1 Tax=Pseudenhygromyxa sp. WMMC2535 TaxID=2712867 RepID=UPI001556AF48|nr:DUF2330 domain-containing protein [Pseudenhygromyxa sp. WMMC2535]NVB37991.1 DUF2330 domain-containing protein [Pseudenhygromyxa sp. WMMC2535]